ncbi:hypothetical protein [Fimbriiglobus ruber]|uniref:Uncharacterized protein n=1 Tax=Fimbriiglobus ruber TaxID=1908690 RepID=A0A225DHL5_9BACT|nr:hypothetical protein [Fimbriiglobus ruber]OWK36679.1 hypothetical protein FRUB_09242 [Fimbriiglobus ruber]
MEGVRQRFLGLCLPPIAFSVLDGSLTLAGQTAEYWGGAYTQANEASPTFHYLLAAHPLAFVGGHLVWVAVFVGIILLLPDTLALIVCIAVTLGHTVGTATWVLWRFHYGYQACNGLFLLAAIALGLGIRWGWRAGLPQEYRLPTPLARWRWVLATALFAVGVYLFLWPRGA